MTAMPLKLRSQEGVVGTTDTQTLTNKTISVDSNTVNGVAANSFVVTDSNGKIDSSASQKQFQLV